MKIVKKTLPEEFVPIGEKILIFFHLEGPHAKCYGEGSNVP
jgi:hypothetical protein